jgi:large subunit ribosomal protein L21
VRHAVRGRWGVEFSGDGQTSDLSKQRDALRRIIRECSCSICHKPGVNPKDAPNSRYNTEFRFSRPFDGGASLLQPLKDFLMYAVIKTGGKQYKVAAGDKLKVEQIAAEVGQEVVFDQVLALGAGESLTLGTPLVANASVKATVVAHGLHDKVRIFKLRRRKHYKKSQGHRQAYTELLFTTVAA